MYILARLISIYLIMMFYFMFLQLKDDGFFHNSVLCENVDRYLAMCLYCPWRKKFCWFCRWCSSVSKYCVCGLFWQKPADVQYGGLAFLHHHWRQRDDPPVSVHLCESAAAHSDFLFHSMDWTELSHKHAQLFFAFMKHLSFLFNQPW